MSIHTLWFKKGIDDLKSIYAFHSSSQGDESASNSVNEYLGSGDWKYVPDHFKDIDYTDQEAVNKRSKELAVENEKYIESLKYSDSFGDSYRVEVTTVAHKEFDKPEKPIKDNLESYRMTFLNFNK